MASSSSLFLSSPPIAPKSTRIPPLLSLPLASAFSNSLRLHPRRSLTAAAAALQAEKQDSVKLEPVHSPPPPSLPFRVGHGFDLHRLEPGLPLIIGGIAIPHDRGCEAHSDGDVLLHCVVDAILGALGLPDIGQIFPDSDPKWKGAASSVFVREAVPCRCRQLNWRCRQRPLAMRQWLIYTAVGDGLSDLWTQAFASLPVPPSLPQPLCS
ncbi:2-C-methyl-D-erythritol 2,4-cyclodiphosphate synthase, chloroplastic-like isoform X2 [Musa acuminata AAA Group]|uniref:2-C-methyl-D-erythritol 2,4-cyclodiphosphate synthase, chloroplastic-like isoform X2 n=1 Tax=Musa acuminata AAA Group TaxID=214697 RepID=UPI0031D239A0